MRRSRLMSITHPGCRLAAGWIGFALVGLVACSGGSKFSETWTNPAYDKKAEVDRIMVVAVDSAEASRRMFEQTLVSALQKQGVTAWPSSKFHVDIEKLPEAKAQQIIRDNQIGSVIVTRLANVDKENVYVPPTTDVVGYPAWGGPTYGSWYGYYSYGYDAMTTPGYTYESVTVSLETNLYAANDSTLIWSGRSETFDPSGAAQVVSSVSELIVEELVENKLVHTGK